MIKYRNRGSDVPPARVGNDISNPDGGVAGGPPALVGDVTQPPTGAPAVDLSTAQQNASTAEEGRGKGGKGMMSKSQTPHPALEPKSKPGTNIDNNARLQGNHHGIILYGW